VCRANGGVYVKAGQFAGAFNAVPPEYRKRLALLQDKAKARPFWTVDRVLRCELGAGAERVFAEFSAEATAAASLAQVHKARLQSGAPVAVKVQYPGLRGAADADLTALSLLSAAAVAAFPGFSLGWLYAELRHKLEEELGARAAFCMRGGGARCFFPPRFCPPFFQSVNESAPRATHKTKRINLPPLPPNPNQNQNQQTKNRLQHRGRALAPLDGAPLAPPRRRGAPFVPRALHP
jgi:hypothetical protein